MEKKKEKKDAGAGAAAKAKPAAAKAKPKAKPKAAGAKADDDEADADGDSPEASRPGTTKPGTAGADGTLPAVGGKGKGGAGGAEAKPGTAGVAVRPATEPSARRKRFVQTRSLPDLSSSLGSAPGLKRASPNERAMGESWPIIQRAIDHLEKKSKLVERIDRDDIAWAIMITRTDKFRKSEEGRRCDGLEINMPNQEEEEKQKKAANAAVSGKSKKREKKKLDRMGLTH